MNVSEKGIEIIQHFERFSSKPYLDTGGVPTIGYGTTRYPDGSRVTMDDAPVDMAVATRWMRYHIRGTINYLNLALKGLEVQQHEFDALVSFVYNIGEGNFGSSTMLKRLKSKDPNACDEFDRWVYDNGRKLKGLERRRASEKHLYILNEVDFYEDL